MSHHPSLDPGDAELVKVIESALYVDLHPAAQAVRVLAALRAAIQERAGLWIQLMPEPKPQSAEEYAAIDAEIEQYERHEALGRAFDAVASMSERNYRIALPVYRLAGYSPPPKPQPAE